MTSPSAGNVIARAFVEIVPDVRDFARRLNRELRQATRSLRQIDRDVARVNRGLLAVARTITGINTSLRLTQLGFRALAVEAVVGGLVAFAAALHEASGALAVMPAVGVAAAAGLGTLVVGLHGVRDALKDFEDPAAFNESLRQLSTNARRTLGVLNEFRPELKRFRDAVQDALFADLEPVARQLGETFLPRVQQNFVGIATAMNDVVKQVAAFALLPETIADVDVTSRNVVRSFQLMRPAGVAAAQALRDFVAVGSQFLPVIAGLVTSIAVRLSQVVAQARASGALEDFMARGIAASLQFAKILFNVGRGVRAILVGAREAGLGLLDTLETVSRRFAEFFESARGQTALQDFLQQAARAARALAPVLGALAELLVGDLLPVLTDFAETVGPAAVFFINALGVAIDVAAPGIHAMAEGFSAMLVAIAPALPSLGRLADALGRLLGALAEAAGPAIAELVIAISGALIPIIEGLTRFIEGLSTEQIKWIISMGLVVAGLGILVSAIRGVFTVIGLLAGSLSFLLSPLGLVLIAIGALIAVFVIAWQKSEDFRKIIRTVGDALKPFFDVIKKIWQEIKGPLLDAFKELEPLLTTIAKIVGVVLIGLVAFLLGLFVIVFGIIKMVEILIDAIEKIAVGTGKLSKFLADFDISVFAEKIEGQAIPAVENYAEAIEATMNRAGNVLDSNVSKFIEWHQGIAAETSGAAGSAAGFATNTGTAMDRAAGAIKSGMDKIRDILHPGFKAAEAAGAAAFAGIAAGASRGMGQAVGAVGSGIGQIRGIITGQDFSAAGAGLIRSLANGMTSAIGFAVSAARAAAAAIARALPGSPAKIGAFSGRGWTPFRGRALVEGLAEGITSSVDVARDAALQLAAVTGTALPSFAPTGLTAPVLNLPSLPNRATTSDAVASTVNVETRVFIDGRELRDVVTEVTTEERRESRRAVLSGVRRSP